MVLITAGAEFGDPVGRIFLGTVADLQSFDTDYRGLVRVRIRRAGLMPFEGDGVITDDGLSVTYTAVRDEPYFSGAQPVCDDMDHAMFGKPLDRCIEPECVTRWIHGC